MNHATPSPELLKLAGRLTAVDRPLARHARFLAQGPAAIAEKSKRATRLWLAAGCLFIAGFVGTAGAGAGTYILSALLACGSLLPAMHGYARKEELRPLRTSPAECRSTLNAIEESEWARDWRDQVVSTGRELLRLDGDICQALNKAQDRDRLSREHAAICEALHNLSDKLHAPPSHG